MIVLYFDKKRKEKETLVSWNMRECEPNSHVLIMIVHSAI